MKIFCILILFILNSCYTSHLRYSSTKYKVQKEGYYVISDDCPEFKRLIKEGHMQVYRTCGEDYCDIYFDKKLYTYYKENYVDIFSNLCIKTKDDLDILYGHNVRTFVSGDYTVTQLPIWTGIKKGNYSKGIYKINAQDSIVNTMK